MYPKQSKGKGGHKHKLSLRDERSIIKSLDHARKQDGNCTSKRIQDCMQSVKQIWIIDRLHVRDC